jgi:putative transposase
MEQHRFNPDVHHRRSIRLMRYDYARPGAYFVTVCSYNRECLFGRMVNGAMELNDAGEMVKSVWDELPAHYGNVLMDQFIIMPNHVHGIIVLTNNIVGAGFKPAPTKRHGLPEIVRAFKTFSSRRINLSRGMPGVPVWQRNYYERVVRNENDLFRIRRYIESNPAQWEDDENNPGNFR